MRTVAANLHECDNNALMTTELRLIPDNCKHNTTVTVKVFYHAILLWYSCGAASYSIVNSS